MRETLSTGKITYYHFDATWKGTLVGLILVRPLPVLGILPTPLSLFVTSSPCLNSLLVSGHR